MPGLIASTNGGIHWLSFIIVKQLSSLIGAVLLFIILARSHGLTMVEELSTSSGRSSPDQPILVPVPPIEESKPHAHHPPISMLACVYCLLSSFVGGCNNCFSSSALYC